jgi:SAM-dependent methyltransferase
MKVSAASSSASSSASAVWSDLLTAASAPYRGAGRFAWRFARGKLGIDPVFKHLLKHGLIAPQARVLDIGCGQGLLASLLRACTQLAQQNRWPQDWAAAPAHTQITGIELMPRDVQRAQTATSTFAELACAPHFICGDMRYTPFPDVDTVVMLDVLHYITVAEQNEVLHRARCALPAGGSLLMRVGDAAAKRRFLLSQWVDALVILVRGHRVVPQFGRTLAEWVAHLESLGFSVQSQPMSQGTPFANVLLVARLQGGVHLVS